VKVLLAFPQRDRHTGWYILKALRMTHRVEVVDPKIEPQMVVDVAKKFKPDLLLCSRTPALFRPVVAAREYCGRVAVWNTDVRGGVRGYLKEFGEDLVWLFRAAHRVFTVADGEVKDMKAHGIQAEWLPQGIDPEENNRPVEDRVMKRNVAFLGSIDKFHERHGQRQTIMNEVRSYFPGLYTERNLLQEANKIYATTRVNLGCNAFRPWGPYNSVRDYKILAAGGFLLTNCCGGIPGEYCAVYDGPGDVCHKIGIWLKNTKQRVEIASAGYQWVHENATYRHRVEQIVSSLFSEKRW
jgi:hypothetical protein